MIVTAIESPSVSSSPTPMMMLALKPASAWIWSLISPISSIVISLVPETISNNTFLAPVILLSFNKGESNAETIASLARFSPIAVAEPIIAVPLFDNTVFASFKSIF
ncbi:hypothetical protein D9M72_575940 [compost metagenome]